MIVETDLDFDDLADRIENKLAGDKRIVVLEVDAFELDRDD